MTFFLAHIFRGYRVIKVKKEGAFFPIYIPQVRQPFSEIRKTLTVWVGIDRMMPLNCYWVPEYEQTMYCACATEQEAWQKLAIKMDIGRKELRIVIGPTTTRKQK